MLFSVEMKAHKEHTQRKKSEMRKDGKVRVMGKKLSYIIGFFFLFLTSYLQTCQWVQLMAKHAVSLGIGIWK